MVTFVNLPLHFLAVVLKNLVQFVCVFVFPNSFIVSSTVNPIITMVVAIITRVAKVVNNIFITVFWCLVLCQHTFFIVPFYSFSESLLSLFSHSRALAQILVLVLVAGPPLISSYTVVSIPWSLLSQPASTHCNSSIIKVESSPCSCGTSDCCLLGFWCRGKQRYRVTYCNQSLL